MRITSVLKVFKEELDKRNIYYQILEKPDSNSKYVLIECGMGSTIRISDKHNENSEVKYQIGTYIKRNEQNGDQFFYKSSIVQVRKICDQVLEEQQKKIKKLGKKEYLKQLREKLIEQKRLMNKFFEANKSFDELSIGYLNKERLTTILNKGE